MDILPLFCSHYSIGSGSLLTLEEPGKAKLGAPLSVFDLSQEVGLKEVVLVDSSIDGFVQAYKTASKLGVKLIFGLKLTVCADMADKTEASLGTQSKAIVFCKSTEGYSNLIRIHNRAAVQGFYYEKRADFTLLKSLWTPNLVLGLPFFSSFIAKNTLTFNRIVPDLPARPWVFREVENGLPFGGLIDAAIDRYAKDNPCEVVPSKTIYYPDPSWMKAHVCFRAVHERSTYDAPGIDHLSSDSFSFANWKRLTQSHA